MADRADIVRPSTPVGRKLDPAARLSIEDSAGAFEHSILDPEAAAEKPKRRPKKEEPEAKPVEPEPEPEPQPEPEPEPVEAEAAPDVLEEPEAEEEEEEAPPKRRFRVKLDDTHEEEVDEDELVGGYLRRGDYTRKTQALAEERKKAEAEFQAVKLERQHYAEYLGKLDQTLKAQTPEEPNWLERAKTAPDTYLAEHAQWQDHKRHMALVEKQAQDARAKVAEDQRKEYDAYKTSEAKKLLDAIPGWKDPQIAEKERRVLWDYAQRTLGYTEAELNGVTDHRAVVALRKAYQADKTQERLPAVRAKLQEIKTASPGPASQTRRSVTEVDRRRAQLKKTGHVKDAGRLIESILE